MKQTRLIYFYMLLVLSLITGQSAMAVTIYVGDQDGFGFTDVSTLVGGDKKPADANNDGVLNPGDTLPDKNRNGTVAVSSGDDFDHRSNEELSGVNGEIWTDVALSSSYSHRPGLARNVRFVFTFTVPEEGDSDYGKDHYVNFVHGDFDVYPMAAYIEGKKVSMTAGTNNNRDGAIRHTYAVVPWEDMLDGQVVIGIDAPGEPYVAFDFAAISPEPLELDGKCCKCDLAPVLKELEKAKAERDVLLQQVQESSAKIEQLLQLLAPLAEGQVITNKDLAPGQGGVYFPGAIKMNKK